MRSQKFSVSSFYKKSSFINVAGIKAKNRSLIHEQEIREEVLKRSRELVPALSPEYFSVKSALINLSESPQICCLMDD